jgi:hypothetical protein
MANPQAWHQKGLACSALGRMLAGGSWGRWAIKVAGTLVFS